MNFLDFDIWSFALIVGIGQGLLFFTILQVKSFKVPAGHLLSILLAILTLSLTEFLIQSSDYYLKIPHFTRIAEPFLYLIGPAVYFFIKAHLNNDFRLREIEWFHFILFFLALAYVFPWYLESAEFKLSSFAQRMNGEVGGVSLTGFLHAFVHISQSIIYAFLALKELMKWRRQKSLNNASLVKVHFLIKFSRVFLVYWIFQLSGLILITTIQYHVYQIDFTLALLNSIFIQFLAFSFLSRPSRLSSFELNKKYHQSPMNFDDLEMLISKMEVLINSQEIYLDSELTLQKFSTALATNKNYVSQAINEKFGIGFIEYINGFRISKAKELMTDPNRDWMKLFAIALESGFNNKTSFNRVFIKHTGKTPSEYRKELVASREKVGHN